MPAGSGQGWSDLDAPVSDLLAPFKKADTRQSWQRQPDGYIFRAESTDALTGKAGHFSFQLVAAGPRQTEVCGPVRYGVSRFVDGDTEIDGWDLINVLPTLIAPAVQARSAAAAQARTTEKTSAPTPAMTTSQAPGPRVRPSRSTNAAGTPIISSSSTFSQDANDAAYSHAYRTCIASEDAAAGVTLAILNCIGDENARQDARLNEGYKAALAWLPAQSGEALRTSERAWIRARDADCKQAMGEEAGGTLGSIVYARCVLKQEAGRANYVEGLN